MRDLERIFGPGSSGVVTPLLCTKTRRGQTVHLLQDALHNSSVFCVAFQGVGNMASLVVYIEMERCWNYL